MPRKRKRLGRPPGSKNIKSKKVLKETLNVIKTEDETDESNAGTNVCPNCDRNFKKEESLRRHSKRCLKLVTLPDLGKPIKVISAVLSLIFHFLIMSTYNDNELLFSSRLHLLAINATRNSDLRRAIPATFEMNTQLHRAVLLAASVQWCAPIRKFYRNILKIYTRERFLNVSTAGRSL